MVVHPPPFAGGLKQSGQARNISNGRRQCLHAGGFWGAHTGPNPTDRAKKGCKRHVLTDANGIPLVVQTGPANQRDDHRLLPLLIDFPILPGPTAGRPRTKPVSVQADAGYGFPVLINLLRWLGITPLLKPRGTADHGSGLGKTRYVVERTHSWFNNFRRLRLCYEKTAAHFQGLHELAAALICAKRLLS